MPFNFFAKLFRFIGSARAPRGSEAPCDSHEPTLAKKKPQKDVHRLHELEKKATDDEVKRLQSEIRLLKLKALDEKTRLVKENKKMMKELAWMRNLISLKDVALEEKSSYTRYLEKEDFNLRTSNKRKADEILQLVSLTERQRAENIALITSVKELQRQLRKAVQTIPESSERLESEQTTDNSLQEAPAAQTETSVDLNVANLQTLVTAPSLLKFLCVTVITAVVHGLVMAWT